MKKLLLTILLLGLAMPAFAFDLGGVGWVEFDFLDWSIGRQYPSQNLQGWVPEGARAGLPGGAQIVPDATVTAGDTVEDSWGILRVKEILTVGGDTLWAENNSGEEIVGHMYGFDDAYIAYDAATAHYEVGQVGGFIDLYLDSTPNFSAAANPATNARPPLGGGGDAWGVTDGSLFLSLQVVPGANNAFPTLTRWESVDGLTAPQFVGDGSMYLAVIGGSHQYLFDSNKYLGGTADMFAKFSFDQSGKLYFDSKSEDPVEGYAMPEPTSMFLMGIGLFGLALRKRKVA